MAGVQPANLAFATALSPAVEAALEAALPRVVRLLADWGSVVEPFEGRDL